MASDSNSGQYDQSGGGGVLPLRRAGLSLQRPPDPMPDEPIGAKHQSMSHRPITGVVNGTRPAICSDEIVRGSMRAKTDRAGEVVGYEAPGPVSRLVEFDWFDGKQRRRGAYTVTVGDREFIDRFERAGKP